MSGNMSWGDSLEPWWRQGWKNTLFGGADATVRTWTYWLSDDGSTGGSLYTRLGTAVNGEPFEIQGLELGRFDDDGLYTEVVMLWPYENADVRRRFNEGN